MYFHSMLTMLLGEIYFPFLLFFLLLYKLSKLLSGDLLSQSTYCSFLVAESTGEEVGCGCALTPSSGENNILPSASGREQRIR